MSPLIIAKRVGEKDNRICQKDIYVEVSIKDQGVINLGFLQL